MITNHQTIILHTYLSASKTSFSNASSLIAYNQTQNPMHQVYLQQNSFWTEQFHNRSLLLWQRMEGIKWDRLVRYPLFTILLFTIFWQWRSTRIYQMQCLIARAKGNWAQRLSRRQNKECVHALKRCVCMLTSLPEDGEQEYSQFSPQEQRNERHWWWTTLHG